MQVVIETCRLVRRFGARTAVDGIDLHVPAGSVFGFLGPNGAGKTTTIRLLLGLLQPTSGTIRMLGQPQPAARRAVARDIGALVETPAHYDHLTGRENLRVTARLLGLRASEIDRVLEVVDLTGHGDRRVGGYSLGMRQRLGIARALLGRPRLLILDEPTNGLDPDGIREMRQLIRALPEWDGATLFVSSHLLAEVEQTATHVALMWQGRLQMHGRLADVLGGVAPALEIGVDDTDAAGALLVTAGLEVTVTGPGRLEVVPSGPAVPPGEVNFLLTAAGIEVSHLVLRRPSLEDLYVRLTAPARPDWRIAA